MTYWLESIIKTWNTLRNKVNVWHISHDILNFHPRYNTEDYRYIKNVLPLFNDTQEFTDVTKIKLNETRILQQLIGPFQSYFNSLQKRLGMQPSLIHILTIRIERNELLERIISSFSYSVILLIASWLLMGFTSFILIPHLSPIGSINHYRRTQQFISFSLGFEWALIVLAGIGYLTSTLKKRMMIVDHLNRFRENNIVRLWLSYLLASHLNTLFKSLSLNDFIESELRYPNHVYQTLLRFVIKETKQGTPFINSLQFFDPYFVRILRLNQFSPLTEHQIDQYLMYNSHLLNRKLNNIKKVIQFSVYIQLSFIILTIYQLILAPLSLMEGLL